MSIQWAWGEHYEIRNTGCGNHTTASRLQPAARLLQVSARTKNRNRRVNPFLVLSTPENCLGKALPTWQKESIRPTVILHFNAFLQGSTFSQWIFPSSLYSLQDWSWKQSSTAGNILRMYLWWSSCPLYLHACQVRLTIGDSGLCCCTCVMYFKH